MALSTFWHHHLVRASFCAALMLALGAGGFVGKVHAADDEVEDTADTKFFKNLLTGFGLRSGDEPGIDYHERSPLVVPPTLNLPPPESKTVASNPAWPKDPDMTRQKKVKKKQLSVADAEKEDMRQLAPDELNPASKTRRREADGPAAAQGPGGARPEQLSPGELGHTGFTFGSIFGARDGKEVKFVKEPERTTLTEPPPGLRTPSPKYTYGSKGKLDPTKEIGTDQAVFGVDK
jgi:hypothetical protein